MNRAPYVVATAVMKKLALLTFTALTIAACGGSPPATATYSGSVGGYSCNVYPNPCYQSTTIGGYAPAPPATTVAYAPPAPPSAQDITRVKLGGSGGVFRVVGVVNDSHRINFILDSGSADVSISPTLFKLLMDNGTLQESDIIDVMKYRTANGGVMEGLRFRIRSIQVGDKIVYNVLGSASLDTQNSGMLLGMSFLRKFKGWAIDNATNELLLK